ncbi:hypothetical protein MIND_00791600 [Mycena indigotica]|uniref:Thioredoxin domain-containing protein n=1 Tax=Mycena indigotica TaxID=2126181 RepID=A0A8H6SP92_9AGAR|nr:uncharacterized protein MIND_00791600 [Mycena indigotica]KAF7302246.1 hypothetical protein MIND_00791600 [Mycena indigotica]
MRLLPFGLALLTTAHAQYFSEGWKPGQAVTAERGVPTGKSGAPLAGGHASPPGEQIPAQDQAPPEHFSLTDLFDMTKLMNTSTVKGLFAKAGINITAQLQAATATLWDERIPLITDDNYDSLVVNEKFESMQEEQERVWIVVVSAQTSRQEGLSKFFDTAFDEAYNETVVAGDLPNVRFARIDYLNVTYLTTKWSLWVAPAIVVIQDRGHTLRFYRPNQLRIAHGALRQFLSQEGYKQTPPWSSAFAPGGSREFVMHYFALGLTKIYMITVRVPRWVLLVVSGSAASFILNLFHGFGPKKKTPATNAPTPVRATQSVTAAAAPAAPTPVAATGSPSGGAKQRKGKKK